MLKWLIDLKKTLENIKADKKAYENFQKLQTLEEVYNICKKYGYKGTYENLIKNIKELLSMNLKSLSTNDLDKVGGGKLDVKKGIAGVFSSLSIINGIMPLSRAVVDNPKSVNEKSTLNQTVTSILNKVDKNAVEIGVGGVAIGAILMKFYDAVKPRNTPEFVTQEAKEIVDEIKQFRIEVNNQWRSRNDCFDEGGLAKFPIKFNYFGERSEVTRLTNSIIQKVKSFISKVNDELNEEFDSSIYVTDFKKKKSTGDYLSPFNVLYLLSYNLNGYFIKYFNYDGVHKPILKDLFTVIKWLEAVNYKSFFVNSGNIN